MMAMTGESTAPNGSFAKSAAFCMAVRAPAIWANHSTMACA